MSDWIPVTSSLPEKGQYVLVNVRCKEFPYISRIKLEGKYDGRNWKCLYDEEYGDYLTHAYTVTHWMPLPEKPVFDDIRTELFPGFTSVHTNLPNENESVCVIAGIHTFYLNCKYKYGVFINSDTDQAIQDVKGWFSISDLEKECLYILFNTGYLVYNDDGFVQIYEP